MRQKIAKLQYFGAIELKEDKLWHLTSKLGIYGLKKYLPPSLPPSR
jgi:hypothetical protein